MSEMETVRTTPAEPVYLKTTLGSCVGIILYHEGKGVHGLAHIMLPEQIKKDPAVGKYADTAIPELVKQMELKGAARRQLKAFLVGGANMFEFACKTDNAGKKGMTLIGDKNVESVKKVLESLEIPVVFEETGGNSGRTVVFFGKPESNGQKAGSKPADLLEVRTLAQIVPRKISSDNDSKDKAGSGRSGTAKKTGDAGRPGTTSKTGGTSKVSDSKNTQRKNPRTAQPIEQRAGKAV
jgi:chemotaxis protein CheD